MNAKKFPVDPRSIGFYEAIYRDETSFGGVLTAEDAQPRIKELAALGALKGRILETGCGVGSNTIYLTKLGYDVVGIDGAPSGIKRAKERAKREGVAAVFAVADATRLDCYSGIFETVFETGLYHCLDEEGRRRYALAVHRATSPGARWFIFCWGAHNVNGIVFPMAPGEEDLRETLSAAGWRIDYAGATTHQLRIKDLLGAMPGDSMQRAAEGLDGRAREKAALFTSRVKSVASMLDEDGFVTVPGLAVYATRV
ncbi:methyltransferase domain-containing protein [Mycobacteroides abscessus subsp. bolletii]|uniref:class I SAM-dependent methyltransferase n=1 Tax=Mycobacteroides abscessus TaxID=36809 RepID=UPI0019CF74AB|nr:class I SAM-dependent methyltransferase [Mycobacteroides abscessus]MBN7304809.1 methyltransferase domain-containing protein [Mycobacteroides abscessus subsp. bolletii]